MSSSTFSAQVESQSSPAAAAAGDDAKDDCVAAAVLLLLASCRTTDVGTRPHGKRNHESVTSTPVSSSGYADDPKSMSRTAKAHPLHPHPSFFRDPVSPSRPLLQLGQLGHDWVIELTIPHTGHAVSPLEPLTRK